MSLFHASELNRIGGKQFSTRRGMLSLEEVVEWFEIGTIVRLFGTWAVTDYGVECMVEYYPIEAVRLRDPMWTDHLAAKNWMTARMLQDFISAASYAKEHFDLIKNKGTVDRAVRFAVLKRDGYRCQLCGRNTRDGTVLEIDHKIPRAKGGTDHRNNLWTLCFDCNRGKRDSDL